MKHVYLYAAWFLTNLLSIYLKCTLADEIIPERAEVNYVNEKYIRDAKIVVRRTGRRSPYYFNGQLTTLIWAANNITFHGITYEFLHNQYKRSFVEFSINYCDVLSKDPWRSIVGKTLEARGLSCPLPPNTYKLENITWSMANCPYVWPFEKAMLELYAKLVPSQEVVGSARLYFTVKHAVPK